MEERYYAAGGAGTVKSPHWTYTGSVKRAVLALLKNQFGRSIDRQWTCAPIRAPHKDTSACIMAPWTLFLSLSLPYSLSPTLRPLLALNSNRFYFVANTFSSIGGLRASRSEYILRLKKGYRAKNNAPLNYDSHSFFRSLSLSLFLSLFSPSRSEVEVKHSLVAKSLFKGAISLTGPVQPSLHLQKYTCALLALLCIHPLCLFSLSLFLSLSRSQLH